ncbi:MAG: aminoacyl-tRNA hydrolase [Nitrospinota bacterium]|nr:aminoacyl-tRNA hydrolase [Nitrospinota bacterium]
MRLFKPRPRPEPGEIVLVIGMGNPGAEYEETRHNIGFLVVDEMAARLGVAFEEAGRCSLADNGSLYDRRVILAKPQTYMNRSGGAVRGLMKAHGLGPADLLAVHDDLDIEFGRVRLKRGGGDGGQRGIRSIIASLGGGDFARIRVGIGRGSERGNEADYVLSPFTRHERGELQAVIDMAVDRVFGLIRTWDRDRIPEGRKGD